MGFEFDPQKSEANAEKHGIDFNAAQLLWADPNRVEFIARFKDEERHGIIASLNSYIRVRHFHASGRQRQDHLGTEGKGV